MDPRVTELHCIMPIANVESIMTNGVLSYERASELQHHSVAMQPVQDRRDQKQVPGGLRLHQYANLYFDARNPMMSARRGDAAGLCVLRISTDILAIRGTVISDQNAASSYVRFLHPAQYQELDFDAIFALDWTHPNDQIAYWRHKAKKCAEVLVPHQVEPRFLTGAYVVDEASATRLASHGFTLPITVSPVIFFR